jgi:type I restriction enzyme M protein
MNKQQLANKIWESANKMRSKIEANEYKDYILGFIFYKYLSDYEVKFLKENDFTDEDIKELVEEEYDGVNVQLEDTNQGYCQRNIGYFIEYKNLFSTWISMGRDFDISNVTDALSAFSRLISPTHKKVFENIFRTLETGLSKLGDTSNARTKAISDLLHLIKDIPMDGKQDYDVLGFIYEYLIEKFASNAGKKAGEFYTPHEVSLLMSEIIAYHLKDRTEIKIYDPTSGSGSLLINIGKSVSKYIDKEDCIKYYAQELKENTYNLTRMNLIMRGIKPYNISTRNADTLEDDWPYFDDSDPIGTYEALRVDAVVSNPPYSQVWDPTNKETDPRYKQFGVAPKSKADYAFLLHELFHLNPDGIMTIVLPHGVLFRGGEEGVIRRRLIEKNHIDAIIGLPANIFFGTSIPTIVMVLKCNRNNKDILFIDASKGFIKDGKNNKLRSSDIKKIVDTYINRENIKHFSRTVDLDDLKKNDFNLSIPRYIDSSEKEESWDIYATMFGGIPTSEIDELNDYWTSFPNLKKDLFTESDIPYVNLKVEDIKHLINEHEDIKKYKNDFTKKLQEFDNYLNEELINNMDKISISNGINVLSSVLFDKLSTIPLIDKYSAFQLLDDEWQKIVVDLEIIQTEGFKVTKNVEPNLIYKNKSGIDYEVQDGWKGRILPFELVQETHLNDKRSMINKCEERLLEIPVEYEEIIESLTDEEKENSFLNEAKDSFVFKEVTNKIKELKKDYSEEGILLKDKLLRVENLQKEEKELRSKIKNETILMHNKTKEVIENLSDDEVYALLKKKWIESIISNLNKAPKTIIDTLIKQIEKMDKKYKETYFDLEREIKETQNILCEMIDQLEGNEYDMKGLSEFKSLLLGDKYE